MVVLRVFGEPLDLDATAVVSISRQVADFGQFQTRLSDYTNKFTLPNTGGNRSKLGVENYESGSSIPYAQQDCSLWFGGVNIASNAKLIVEEIGDRIKVSILPGSSILFDIIKTKPLRDLELGFSDNLWDQVIVTASQLADWTDGYTFAITNTGNQSNSATQIQSRGLVPGVFEKFLIKAIAEENDYLVDFPVDEFMEKLWMPITTQLVGEKLSNEVSWKTEKDTQTRTSGFPVFFEGFNLEFEESSDWLNIWDQLGTIFQGNILRLPYRGVYTFKVSGNFTSTSNRVLFNAVYVQGQIIGGSEELDPSVENSFEFTASFEVQGYSEALPYDQWIRLTVICSTISPEIQDVTVTNLKFDCIDFVPVETNWHRPLSIQTNLPNIKQGDVFKEFAKKTGCLFLIDDVTKVVTIRTLNDVMDSFVNAYDWQSKINVNFTPIKKFTIGGFAQVNQFFWKEPSNYDYTLPIENTQLPDTVDFIKSIFEVGTLSNIYNNLITCGLIPIWDADLQRLKLDNKNRVLLVTQVIQSLNFTDPIEGDDTTTRYNVATYDGLQWQQLYERYYERLFERLIELMAQYEMEFMLDEFDVIDFDFSRPIYLDNPNGFFFVRQIKEFTGRELPTRVILFRL
jgi:hypothetical protein